MTERAARIIGSRDPGRSTTHIVDHGDGWFVVGFRHVNGRGSWTACRFHEIGAEIANLRERT